MEIFCTNTVYSEIPYLTLYVVELIYSFRLAVIYRKAYRKDLIVGYNHHTEPTIKVYIISKNFWLELQEGNVHRKSTLKIWDE